MKFFVVILSLLFASPAFGQSLEVAKQEGAILLMRHAIAPGTGDPANLKIGDCATQRNLSDEGRKQAKQVGKKLVEAKLGINRVLTSQWCRTRETAELLGFGVVEEWPSLNSFFGNQTSEPAQTAEALKLLSQFEKNDRPILVTHQVNIFALTGVSPRSGEIIVVKMNDRAVEVIGRIAPGQ